MKTPISGALIPYGRVLPNPLATSDGSLFYKTVRDPLIPGVNELTYNAGLYVFGFVHDTDTAAFGDQVAQRWGQVTYTGVDADTLDGNDSLFFQPADSDLLALSNTSTNGIYIRTGDGTSATRTISAASARINIGNGNGLSASNITIDVSEPDLVLNNISGTLSVAKGGTGQTTAPAPGSIIYGSSGTAYAANATGTAGFFLLSGGAGAPTWNNPTGLTVGQATNATNAINANVANFANQLTNARNITLSGRVAGSVFFSGASDVTINTDVTDLLALENWWTGVQRFYSSNTVNGTAFSPLQPSATFGNEAYLTFHRVAAYALNIGLNTFNEFVIGGASDGFGTQRLRITSAGNLISTGNVTAFSDLRLKRNVKPIRSALQKVKNLHGVVYERIDNGDKATGLIAQDVKLAMPEAVITGEDGIMSVAYGNLVGLLVEAIKEQQAQIDELRARLD